MNVCVQEIVKATGGRLVLGYPQTPCRKVSIDTRTLQSGDIFFALRGPRFDGHRFLKVASRKRAQALVVDRLEAGLDFDVDRTTHVIQVGHTLKALQDTARMVRSQADHTLFIGLTGSNGKTTTKDMLALILQRSGKTLSTRGNLNNHIGLPLMLTEWEPDHRYALLELGTSMPGDMDLLADLLRPQVALITNVGKDHLESFKTPQGVVRENRKLFDALPHDGIAVINLDDPLLKECRPALARRVVTYGLAPEADVRAEAIVAYPSPLRFTLKLGSAAYPVVLQVSGVLQVQNALAAAALAYALGISPDMIVGGLQQFKSTAMRMEVRTTRAQITLVNDAYNANPSSMRASIESFCRSYPDRPKWLVLSDMRELGPGAPQEHRELGQWLAPWPLERLYLYGRDARYIQEGALAAHFKGAVERYRKKVKLIEALQQALANETKTAILFKASRRMKLEEVTHALSSLSS